MSNLQNQGAATSVNPATSEGIKHYSYQGEFEPEQTLQRTNSGYKAWAATTPSVRAKVMVIAQDIEEAVGVANNNK